MDEVIFETYGFAQALVAPAQLMAAYDPLAAPPAGSGAERARAALVLDAGFSYTYAVPVFDGRVIRTACRRINLGGKALTNYLKARGAPRHELQLRLNANPTLSLAYRGLLAPSSVRRVGEPSSVRCAAAKRPGQCR